MSKRYRPWKITEPMLLPATVQDFVDKDHLARFVLHLVIEEIDLEEIERVYRVDRGQPPFDPAMMTALLLYGYCHGVYSSRRIAKLRHDHGSNYMSGDFQDEIKCLGIEASPSFVRQPEGNGVAERFIRTLKENLLWVRAFKTIEELRAELVAFARRYNETWLVAR